MQLGRSTRKLCGIGSRNLQPLFFCAVSSIKGELKLPQYIRKMDVSKSQKPEQ